MSIKYIQYTGIGAKRKNGKHTVEEFLDIMNKNFQIECSIYLTGKNKYCKEYESEFLRLDNPYELESLAKNVIQMVKNVHHIKIK